MYFFNKRTNKCKIYHEVCAVFITIYVTSLSNQAVINRHSYRQHFPPKGSLFIVCANLSCAYFMQSTAQNNKQPFQKWFQALYLLDTMLNCRCQNYGNDGPEIKNKGRKKSSGLIITHVFDPGTEICIRKCMFLYCPVCGICKCQVTHAHTI